MGLLSPGLLSGFGWTLAILLMCCPVWCRGDESAGDSTAKQFAIAVQARCRYQMAWTGQALHEAEDHACNPKVRVFCLRRCTRPLGT